MNEQKDVPYIVFEGEQARSERIIKRLWIALILVIVLLVGSNVWWVYYDHQFSDEVTTTIEADATDGGNAVITRDGEVTINGTRESNEND